MRAWRWGAAAQAAVWERGWGPPPPAWWPRGARRALPLARLAGRGIVHANGPLFLTDGEQLPLGEADKGDLQRRERRRWAVPPGRPISAFTLGGAAGVIHHPGKALSSQVQIPAPAPPTPLPCRAPMGTGCPGEGMGSSPRLGTSAKG